jgi:hypothetical protein
MATWADIGYGVQVSFTPWTDALGTSPGTTIAIGEITDVSGPSMSKEAVEATHTDSPSNYVPGWTGAPTADLAQTGWLEFIDGMIDAGELSLDVNLDPDVIPMVIFAKGELLVEFPLPQGLSTPATFTCDAVCTAYDETVPVKSKMSAKITFKLSGRPTFTASA